MSEKKPTKTEAITAALKEARLDESDRSIVEFYLGFDDDSWRACCGSDCIPCMNQVAQAVDHARGLLERGEAS